MQGKQPAQVSLHDLEDYPSTEVGDDRPGYTKNDRRDMYRMGKRQELMRNFSPISALSFTALLQATWEFVLIANTQGLVDGGLAGLFWSYVWTFFGSGIVMLSLAEMASMCPSKNLSIGTWGSSISDLGGNEQLPEVNTTGCPNLPLPATRNSFPI